MQVAANRCELTVASALAAEAGAVWDRVTSVAGIRDEMRPWIRMTLPRGLERLEPESIRLGEPIGRSWLLLFGLLPFDYDDLTLVRLDPGRGFLERSQMLSQRRWEHERTLEPTLSGCTITDRVAWEPRGPLPAGWLAPIIGWFFRRRHARLRRRFGVPPGL